METTGERRVGPLFEWVALWALASAALLAGSILNAFRAEPLPWRYRSREEIINATVARLQEQRGSSPGRNADAEPTHEIRLDEFQSFVAEHKGAVIDTRAAVFYREAHVPGALSLPRETFADDYARLRGQLDAYKDRPVALYCSGADCPDAQLMAEALTELGFRKLVIYTSGWEEWSQTGLPQEGAAAAP